MKEYIEREALLKQFNDTLPGKTYCTVESAVRRIKDTPAADVVERSVYEAVADKYVKIQDKLIRGELVERKRGEWVENDKGDTVCSECGAEGHFVVGWFGKMYLLGKFCHDCGADMREVDHA